MSQGVTQDQPQYILNKSFDPTYQTSQVELVGFDSGNNVLRPIKVDANGQVYVSGALSQAAADALYQPLDGDLTTISSVAGVGYLRKTAADTWGLYGLVVSTGIPLIFEHNDDTTLTTLELVNKDSILDRILYLPDVDGTLITSSTADVSYLKLNQSTPQTVTASPKFSWLTSGGIPVISTDGTLVYDAGITFNTTTNYLTLTGPLKSSKYFLGADAVIAPVFGGQSVIQVYWALQLVGNNQTDSATYTPANFGAAGSASVIIPNQKLASVGLIVAGAASQTADILQIQSSAGVIYTAFDSVGKILFGPSGSQDTNLYRSAANTLATDDLFYAPGGITCANLTDSGLTAGGIPVISDAGLLVYDAGITFNTSTNYLTLTGPLKSSKYFLGIDAVIVPVAGGQSVIQAWWGIQIVGNNQTDSATYTPANFGLKDDASVIIPNQKAAKVGLIVAGAASQTGNIQEWQSSASAVLAYVSKDGDINSAGVFKVDGTQVVSNQGAAVADATDAATAITQLNALLARLRTHGLIAT